MNLAVSVQVLAEPAKGGPVQVCPWPRMNRSHRKPTMADGSGLSPTGECAGIQRGDMLGLQTLFLNQTTGKYRRSSGPNLADGAFHIPKVS